MKAYGGVDMQHHSFLTATHCRGLSGQNHVRPTLLTEKEVSCSHKIEGLVVFGTGLDVSAKIKILLLRGIEPDSSIVSILTELSQFLFQLHLAPVINSEHTVNTTSPFQRPSFIV